MSLFPCDLKYVTILPPPPAPSIQRQLMQLLRRCCRWGLCTGAFSAIYVPIHHQTCPQRKMHLWVIQNPHYPHPTPTSARLSVVTLNFKVHPGALHAVGWSSFQGCSVFHFFTRVILHVAHAEAPESSFSCPLSPTFSLYQILSILSPESLSIPSSSQFCHLCHLHPHVSWKRLMPTLAKAQTSHSAKFFK